MMYHSRPICSNGMQRTIDRLNKITVIPQHATARIFRFFDESIFDGTFCDKGDHAPSRASEASIEKRPIACSACMAFVQPKLS